ncbi:MAG: hypothetical protein ACI8WB_000720 [Phenylobacterium sp.]|jgi:hypothetical protein
MVTISAFTLALIAIAIVVYSEYCNFKAPVNAVEDVLSGQADTDVNAQGAMHSEHELCYEHQMPRENAISFFDKLKAVFQFIHFIFFMSPEAKKLLIRRNELTAEQLLKEYQSFIMAPAKERVDRFLQWQDDIAHFEANQNALHSVKSDAVEFRFR